MKKTIFLLIVAILSGCRNYSVTGDPGRISAKHPLVSGSSRFSFSLFRELLKGEQGNVFISPLSLYLALGMAQLGAGGRTASEMRAALHLPAESNEVLSSKFGDLIAFLERSSGKSTLSIGNSLWAQKGYSFLKVFLDRCRIYFGAPVRNVHFGSGEGKRKVNSWINKKTRGMIPKMLAKPLSSVTRMLLVNSIYFKGKWKKSFPVRDTKEGAFYRENGSRMVPMMRVYGSFPYMENDRLQAVLMPYRNSGLAMGVVLPRKGVSGVLEGFTAAEFRSVLGRMYSGKGRIIFPKFKMEFGVKKMKTILRALGMRQAFSRMTANFSRMDGTRKLFMQEVLHKAVVEVDEKGSVAAAATVVQMGIKSAAPQKPFLFHANRPFLFFILDVESRVVLFIGVMRDPENR